MITEPSTEQLLEKVNDRYELVTVISKRARQLVDGAEPLSKSKELSKLTVAAIEFAEEKYHILKDETTEENLEEKTSENEIVEE